jgi:DNA-binding NarL/FixJ family response regulator
MTIASAPGVVPDEPPPGPAGAQLAPGQPPADRIRVSVVEDHPLYRSALAGVLREADGIFLDVVTDSVGRFAASRPGPGGVVVLGVNARGAGDGAAVLQVIGMGHSVLVVSAYAARSDVLGAMSAGARGYLSKESEGSEILRAIREIAAGNSYVSPTLASFVLNGARGGRISPRIELSGQERQVLGLVAAGQRDQDIATAMGISVRTVRSYLDRIRDKVGARRRADMTRVAIELGVLAEPFSRGLPVLTGRTES